MLLKYGSNNSDVYLVQNSLQTLNYNVGAVDGIFGSNTVNAVKSYQADHGLSIDGIVGENTWTCLMNSIKSIQAALNSFDAGIIVDGIVGINTKSAILNFQSAHGLVPDGIVGPDTMNALELSNNCNSGSLYNISDAGVRFIADYEQYYAEPYRGLDSQNRTIGYGHVILDNEDYSYLTQEQAIELLNSDLQKYVHEVNELVAGIELTQNQFDSLVSFGYNCGCGVNGLKTSTLLKDIKNYADSDTIRNDFMMWCMCNGKKSLGLYRRRNDEANLYINGSYERTYINF